MFSTALGTARSALAGGQPSGKPAPSETVAYFENQPASNPYRALLLRYATLPKAERAALDAWSNGPLGENDPPPSLTDAQHALARELSTALVAAGSAANTTREDWPLPANPNDPDNPMNIIPVGIGTTRALAQIAVKDAATLPPGEAAAVYVAAAQFGRQQRSGSTLIEQLTGIALESIAQAEAAKRLNEFSAEELARLSALWDQLKPPPSNAEAVAGEREVFFLPWVEKIIVPGLRALIEDPGAGSKPDDSDDANDFTKNLRLSGLMDLGGGQHRIILEDTRSGESLALDLGRATERIRLVSLDYEKRVAVISNGQSEAVVHLESKRIVRRPSHAATLRRMFEFSDIMGGSDRGKSSLAKMLTLAREHPGGPEGYGKDLVAAYQAGVDRHLQQAEKPQPDSEYAPHTEDPFLDLAVSSIGRIARIFNSSATHTMMFQAAIQHRLGQLGHSIDHSAFNDPWSDNNGRFYLKPAEDGAGFILTSRYEVRPGQPVTYKFGAPDAGFVRVITKP